MRLEQTIRSTMTEAMDMDGRLDQLVRAGLMPTSSLPLLKRAIARMHAGMSLQGAERDVMNMFISSMMFIVLGDDTVFNKARAGAKGYATEETEDDGWYTHSQIHGSIKSEKHPKGISAAEWKSGIRWHHGKNKRINIKEEVELDENAKVAAHLIKRYGENVRQSHVRSAAGDLGVDASKLSKAVRKKLGKTMLPEAKEKTEYDYEGDMAMGQLKSIIANSQRMHDMLSDDTNLPEWVQSKITLAEDYISTASNYMQGEMNEEKMPFEGPYRKVGERKDKYGNPVKNVAKHLAKKAMNDFSKKNEEIETIDELSIGTMKSYGDKRARTAFSGGRKPGQSVDAGIKMKSKQINSLALSKTKINRARDTGSTVLNKEEIEQIDELSPSTMGSYAKKASADFTARKPKMGYDGQLKKMQNRRVGVNRALDKMYGEEAEQIDELSHDTLRRYRMKAKSIGDNEKGDINYRAKGRELAGRKTYGGRMTGIEKAKVMAKEEADLEEKLNMDKASMGTVIKDFQKSDAPQFMGKSQKKRQVMAVAAKLTAERGKLPMNKEQRLLVKLDDLAEVHKRTMISVFEKLNEDNQYAFMQACDTAEGIEQMLDFSISYRGE